MDKNNRTKKTVPDTICRVHRSGGYAVLSNCFVRSTNIGCDSIGLLGKINDLPPTWNFTIAGLVSICEDGETAIKSQLAELEQWGYGYINSRRSIQGNVRGVSRNTKRE